MEFNQLPPAPPVATPLDDLDALLDQPTSYIPPPPVASGEGQAPPPPVDAPDLDPGDFEPAALGDAPAGEPVKNRAFFRRQAKQFVRTFDVAQKSVLGSFVYPRSILEPGDRELVADYKARYAASRKSNRLEIPAEGDPLFAALKRYERLDRMVGELALSEDEKADLIAPLTDVLEKHQKKALTPEWALVMAVALIMLPRLEPMFPKLFASLTK